MWRSNQGQFLFAPTTVVQTYVTCQSIDIQIVYPQTFQGVAFIELLDLLRHSNLSHLCKQLQYVSKC